MIQTLYQKAIKFAGEKHSDQKAPGSKSNYAVPTSNVAMEVMIAYNSDSDFDLDLAVQIALLHDTIEDTSTTYSELESLFGKEVASGIQALTKDSSISTKKDKMADSLNRINALSKEVGIVKIADRITNLQKPPAHWEADKISNYLSEVTSIAEALWDKNDYLYSRINEKIEEYEKFVLAHLDELTN
ncbi:bifunctional (p)ppGpp synthetase/guanosine-3',5'-bis(diphosphate) 3'-pyrophosphohydrolase [Crocinitomix catalasitica]|nr:bifunctional (p)ppGpp synthetase/guanosine-3',5'-bis(diphosphate) 3'-pyrophosphohydrolase [Crocinitomix catalasitica]